MSSVTDYNRNTIHYGYDIDNDNLLSVSTTVDGEPNNNVLSYNKGYLTRLVQNDTVYDYTYEYKGRIAKLIIGNVTYFENT